jgi:hypothetical protein
MTSIVWLKKQLEDFGFNSHLCLDWNTFDKLCEQAKKMHYKELMDSMQKGMEIQQKYNSRKGFRERNNLSNDKTNG